MPLKDEKLIEKAFALHPINWWMAWEIAEQAGTQAAKDYIISIGKGLYHKEEML